MSVKLQLQNKIINGGFNFWQRGTSFPTIAANTYTADRWRYSKIGAAVHTVSISSDVPSSSSNPSSLLIDCTTIDSSLTGADNCQMTQRIEGNTLRSFKNKKMVLRFWVKATKTGTYCIGLRNGDNTRSLVKEYVVNSPDTWEQKTVRFQHDSAGTWLYDTGLGLQLTFTLSSGPDIQTSPDVWQSGNFIATVNQVNSTDSTLNNFYLSDVVLVEDNEGQSRDPDFMYAAGNYIEEFRLCQRYYSNPLGTIDGTGDSRVFAQGYNGSTTAWQGTISLPVQMRASPTVTLGPAASWRVYAAAAVFTPSAVAVVQVSNMKFGPILTCAGLTANTIGNAYYATNDTLAWIADAEL